MSETADNREYQAIDPKDKTRRESVELRLKDGRRYWLKHADRHLMALSPDQTKMTIFFYSMSVVILGRNLAEVATAIDGRNTAWLQEFDAARFDVADGRAVRIDRIELYQPKADEDGEGDTRPAQMQGKPGAATH